MNIKTVTKMTGLTSKTLRHWEAVGLLKTKRDTNDYRLYDSDDLTKIFYIMSLRKLDLPLMEIAKILTATSDEKTALKNHLERLKNKQNELENLIKKLTKKLGNEDYKMSEIDFELLKKQKIAENDAKYGNEIRDKYGVEIIEKSNEKLMAQSSEEIKWANETHKKIVKMLEDAYEQQDKYLAYEAVKLHRTWLEHFWPEGALSAEAHIGLGQIYCDDIRFRANYNQKFADLPEFFYNSIIRFYE
jgi:DNA-binding transcriptional MerR regulator